MAYQRATVLCPKKSTFVLSPKVHASVLFIRYLIKGFINHTLLPKGKKRKNLQEKECEKEGDGLMKTKAWGGADEALRCLIWHTLLIFTGANEEK